VTTTYILTYIDTNGCLVTDSVTIYVDIDYVIEIPSIFTPNKDDLNDLIFPIRDGIKDISFIIYNRWGQIVYETVSLNGGWDGTYKGDIQPVGVYLFKLEANSYNGKAINRQGTITLIR
jgi:gliding motility-associated-like protein